MTNTTESKCEDLNDQQIKIYNNQIKFVEDKICDQCEKDYWELIDLYLKGYYYDTIHEIDLDTEIVIKFDLLLMMEDPPHKKCFKLWEEYIDMEDQRFRLDIKKMECYDQLSTQTNNERMWNKFTK